MVSSLDKVPTEPVTLDNVNLNMIDNMFIVNPPKEIKKAVEESAAASSDGSTSISQTVNTGEWYNCQIIIVHNDDNVYHEVEWWIASGDNASASGTLIGRTGDVSRINNPTFSTSRAVKTITFSASSTSNGSSLRAYMLKLQ